MKKSSKSTTCWGKAGHLTLVLEFPASSFEPSASCFLEFVFFQNSKSEIFSLLLCLYLITLNNHAHTRCNKYQYPSALPSPSSPQKMHPDSEYTSLLSTWEDKEKKLSLFPPGRTCSRSLSCSLFLTNRFPQRMQRGRPPSWVSQGVQASGPVPILFTPGEAARPQTPRSRAPTAQIWTRV